jgi:hypothetical protein
MCIIECGLNVNATNWPCGANKCNVEEVTHLENLDVDVIIKLKRLLRTRLLCDGNSEGQI